MSAAGIGRLLTASLHQALTELLPSRLPFYEPWLSTDGFRTSRVSLAGIRAAFSFLRQEDDHAYARVMRRAGELAALWAWQSLSPPARWCARALPAWARRRVAGRLARRVALGTWQETRASVRWRRGCGRIVVDSSLFCDARATSALPLCGYYAAVFAQFLDLAGVPADVEATSCVVTGGERCEVQTGAREAPGGGAAAMMVLAAAAAVAAGAGEARAQVHPPAVAGQVLVLPFEHAGLDPRLAWLGEGAAMRVTDCLREAGTEALTRDDRVRIFDRLQIPVSARLSRATTIRIGELVGASLVVTGTVAQDGGDLLLRARRIHVEAGRLDPDVTERARPGEVMVALRRLAARLSPVGEGTQSPDGSPSGEPSLAAFEAFVKGVLAPLPATQAALLASAVKADPHYDPARLALWQSRTAAGEHRAALEAARAVGANGPHATEAKFLEALSLIHLGQFADAIGVLKALHERTPAAVFLNDIGVAALRAGGATARAERPAWYFSQARTMDGLEPDYVFNLGYAYWVDGDPDAAAYWLRECVRLDPTDASAHALLARALHAAGEPAEAARELTLAQRLSSEFANLGLETGAVPAGLERLTDVFDPARARRVDAALEMVGQRDQQALAAFYLDRGRRLAAQDLDRDAEAELTRALYLAPYEAEAHLLLSRIYLRTGRVREAIDAAKVSLWSEAGAAAHLALAEALLEARDPAGARAEAERALALDPGSVHARKLIERLARSPGV